MPSDDVKRLNPGFYAKSSKLEQEAAAHLRNSGVQDFEREYFFHPKREWRFDFAWPAERVALEVEGGTWMKKKKSRHTTGKGFEDDAEKYNTAASLGGWLVIRVTSRQIRSGQMVGWVKDALSTRRCHGTIDAESVHEKWALRQKNKQIVKKKLLRRHAQGYLSASRLRRIFEQCDIPFQESLF